MRVRHADDAARVRDDELAEMELRILVVLYDAWPGEVLVRPGRVFRPAGRYTGLGEAPAVMRALLAGRVTGHLGPAGLIGGRLHPATRTRLEAGDGHGTPWIDRARAVLAESIHPVIGHAVTVRDGIRGAADRAHRP